MATTSDNAAFSGDLEWLRDLLASSLEEVEPQHRAPLAREYRAVLADLAALPRAEQRSRLDELKARRESKSA